MRSRYWPGVAQRVGTGITLLFHDRSTRRGWVVSSKPRPHFTPGKDTVHILQETGWAPGPVWTGGKCLPYRVSIPDRPSPSQSQYGLSYPAHWIHYVIYFKFQLLFVCVCVCVCNLKFFHTLHYEYGLTHLETDDVMIMFSHLLVCIKTQWNYDLF